MSWAKAVSPVAVDEDPNVVVATDGELGARNIGDNEVPVRGEVEVVVVVPKVTCSGQNIHADPRANRLIV